MFIVKTSFGDMEKVDADDFFTEDDFITFLKDQKLVAVFSELSFVSAVQTA